VGRTALGSFDYLKTIKQPTLVVNGSKDLIIYTVNSFILQQNIANAQLILYPTPITGRRTSIPSCSYSTSRCFWAPDAPTCLPHWARRRIEGAKPCHNMPNRSKDRQGPGPDHPIMIERNVHRVVVKVAGRIVADTRQALTLREASYPAVQYVRARTST